MKFDDILEMLFGALLIGIIANWVIGGVIAAMAAAMGIVGIATWQLCAFIAFVGMFIYKLIRGGKGKSKDDDDS